MMEELVQAAEWARSNAYAPYSGYLVGAAVRDEQGRVFAGCNVENVSFGATVCAEQNAVFAMVAHGGREVRAVALLTEDGGTPCGMCLQVLSEFIGDPANVCVLVQADGGERREYRFADLLPHGFRSREVPRTDQPGR